MKTKRKCKKLPSWDSRVCRWLIEKQRFDISNNGSKVVTQEITFYALRDCTELERCQRFPGYHQKIRGALPRAVRKLEEDGIAVKKHIPTGKRNIECISLEEDEDMEKKDLQRCRNQKEIRDKALRRHLKVAHPNLFGELPGGETKLLE